MKNINSQKGGVLLWIIIIVVIVGGYWIFTRNSGTPAQSTTGVEAGASVY